MYEYCNSRYTPLLWLPNREGKVLKVVPRILYAATTQCCICCSAKFSLRTKALVVWCSYSEVVVYIHIELWHRSMIMFVYTWGTFFYWISYVTSEGLYCLDICLSFRDYRWVEPDLRLIEPRSLYLWLIECYTQDKFVTLCLTPIYLFYMMSQ